MEAKLEAYRLRKRRKQQFEQIKSKILSMIPFRGGSIPEEKTETVVNVPSDPSETASTTSDILSETISDDDQDHFQEEEEPEPPNPLVPENKLLKYVFWMIFFLFWATCYVIAIELKFGIVYLIISALFGIYYNTRTGPRRKGEVSAYSVFNKNCESIDGTLKAEQFEREIRFGAAAVR